jgi:hypothetical protein
MWEVVGMAGLDPGTIGREVVMLLQGHVCCFSYRCL